MYGLIIDPGKAPQGRFLPNTQSELEQLLGGTFRIHPLARNAAALLYVHGEGRELPNRRYIDRWYYGRLVIVGYDRRQSRMRDLSEADEACLAGKWMGVEAER